MPEIDYEFSAADEEEAFSQALLTLLSSETGDNGEPLDKTHTPSDIDPESATRLRHTLVRFLESHTPDVCVSGLDMADTGHCYILSRNGHGTGFSDCDLGTLGRNLHFFAQEYGEIHAHLGDDGKIYLS